jgi:hypothetical protein
MFEYPIEKYRFYTATKVTGEPYRVVAVSTYEGKTVRGVAKCDPRDAFDMELGKQLAAARCNQKIARKRARRAEKRFEEADERMKEARAHASKMNDYMFDAHKALRAADETVNKLLEKI